MMGKYASLRLLSKDAGGILVVQLKPAGSSEDADAALRKARDDVGQLKPTTQLTKKNAAAPSSTPTDNFLSALKGVVEKFEVFVDIADKVAEVGIPLPSILLLL